MLDRLDFRVTLREGRGAICLRHILNPRLDLRFILKIDAPKTDSCIRRRRHKRHVHPIATMQAHTGVTHRLSQRLLLLLQHRAGIYALLTARWQVLVILMLSERTLAS